MMKVTIQTIPHSTQRYETVGDWRTKEEGFAPDQVQIVVSKLDDEREEFLIAVHELIEWFLAKQRGISASEVTEFDMDFEDNRSFHEKEDILEPGDHPDCPVYHEHRFATVVERMVAHELNVDWRTYERHLWNLEYNPTGKRTR